MDPNWVHWERLADRHGRGGDHYYDLDAIVAGADPRGDEERRAIEVATRGRGVRGRDVVHLQCHLGGDAVALARDGARVTAVDFSPTALRRARELAERCGVPLATVLADARDLPPTLDATADLVYATIGVLAWIDDLDAWMGGVARVLRPGGALALVEIHPLLTMFASVEPPVLDFPYAFDGPHRFSESGSYAGVTTGAVGETVQFAHSLGEVVTSATGAGLVVEHLEEHLSAPYNPLEVGGAREGDGRFRLRLGGPAAPPLPVLVTLVARRPAA